jgi:hypothetical protein
MPVQQREPVGRISGSRKPFCSVPAVFPEAGNAGVSASFPFFSIRKIGGIKDTAPAEFPLTVEMNSSVTVEIPVADIDYAPDGKRIAELGDFQPAPDR